MFSVRRPALVAKHKTRIETSSTKKKIVKQNMAGARPENAYCFYTDENRCACKTCIKGVIVVKDA